GVDAQFQPVEGDKIVGQSAVLPGQVPDGGNSASEVIEVLTPTHYGRSRAPVAGVADLPRAGLCRLPTLADHPMGVRTHQDPSSRAAWAGSPLPHTSGLEGRARVAASAMARAWACS